MKLAETIEYLRKKAGLSQQEFSDRLGVSRSLIGMIESGQRKPSRETLEAIADYFNVSMDFLAGRVDTGEYSTIFRQNLRDIVSSCSNEDLVACGLDPYEVNLVIDGTLSLTFEYACQLSDRLGVSLDTLLGQKDPASMKESEVAAEINYRLSLMSDKQVDAALQYLRFLSESEEK